MLVLRRRSQEVIVFEGGLTLAVVELVDHHAWLSLEGPGIVGSVTFSPMSVDGDSAKIGIRSPASVTFSGDNAVITRSESADANDDRAVLLLRTRLGGKIDFGPLVLELSSVANNRAALAISTECLPSLVTIAVHTVSGVEARIGIDAPPEVRVTRKELWLEMLASNQAAAESSAALDALKGAAEESERDVEAAAE